MIEPENTSVLDPSGLTGARLVERDTLWYFVECVEAGLDRTESRSYLRYVDAQQKHNEMKYKNEE